MVMKRLTESWPIKKDFDSDITTSDSSESEEEVLPDGEVEIEQNVDSVVNSKKIKKSKLIFLKQTKL